MGDVVLGEWRGHKRKQGSVYCIEGEYLSAEQIAARLGISKAAALARMGKLKAQPGAITWKRLRG